MEEEERELFTRLFVPERPIFYAPDGSPIDALEWGRLREEYGNIRVAYTKIGRHRRRRATRAVVSTVWLGIDHSFSLDGPPVIFETMVFGGLLDMETHRYTTREYALIGHRAVVELVREANEKLDARETRPAWSPAATWRYRSPRIAFSR